MRVLVTRPEPGASATAERLRERGHEAVKLPLTQIEAIVPEWRPDAAKYDAVAATSGNALRSAPDDLLRQFTGIPFFAVGARTAEAAREAGFSDVREGGGTADTLAGDIAGALPHGSRVLYLAGRVRTGDLAGDLARRGLQVDTLETYDTVAAEIDEAALARAAGDTGFDAVLVHSAEGARRLAELAGAAEKRAASSTARGSSRFPTAPRNRSRLSLVRLWS